MNIDKIFIINLEYRIELASSYRKRIKKTKYN